jgi:Lipase (class 3)
MDSRIFYSARREDLYSPWKRGDYFSAGPPLTETELCTEISRLAYCRTQSSFAFDRERIQGILARFDFTYCQFFESRQDSEGRGTHCFLALRNSTAKEKKLAVVAFRGTDANDPSDLADDADFVPTSWQKGGRVHRGFAKALEEIWSDLQRGLQTIDCRVLFTGHSLGAAMATLLASARKPDFLYTFGSPRVGDAEFVSCLEKVPNSRYVDCCDLVARIPPELLGFTHVGKPYYITASRRLVWNPDEAVMTQDQNRAREEYILNYSWRMGNVAIRDLADHAPINYVSAIVADRDFGQNSKHNPPSFHEP